MDKIIDAEAEQKKEYHQYQSFETAAPGGSPTRTDLGVHLTEPLSGDDEREIIFSATTALCTHTSTVFLSTVQAKWLRDRLNEVIEIMGDDKK